MMREHGADRMIHGHTHRPARHPIDLGEHVGERVGERIVLGDWYAQGSMLIARGDQLELRSIARGE